VFPFAIFTFLFLTAVFFFIFWYFCIIWTGRKRFAMFNVVGALMVALLHFFKILLLGSILFALIYLALILLPF